MSTINWTIEKKLCRCCHAEGDFINLSEPCFESGNEEVYVDMIKDCFFINLVPVPGQLCAATYTICESCIISVKDAAKFRKKVATCEEKFKEFCSRNAINVKAPVVDIAVKEELPDSSQEDDFSMEDDHNDNFDDLPDYGFDEEENKSDSEETAKKKPKKVQSKPTKAKSSQKRKKGRPKKMKEEPQPDEEEEAEKRKDYPQVDDFVTEARPTDKKYTCKACDIAYRRVSDLRYHINRTHLKKKFIKCKLCPESFMYHSQRKQHMNIVHSIKKSDKFLCGNCNRQFKRKNTLAEHMMDVHIEKKCQHCHLKFARKKYLFHMNEAHDIPMPTCGICGLRTLMKSALIRHQRNVHLNEKRKECRICKKMFHTESNLRDHMITHNQNRVFKCDVCQKDFARKECFQSHYRLHTGERPFLCNICEASFVQRASLRFHLKSRHHRVKTTACDSSVM